MFRAKGFHATVRKESLFHFDPYPIMNGQTYLVVVIGVAGCSIVGAEQIVNVLG